MEEELRSKVLQAKELKNNLVGIIAEVRETCSLFRTLAILKTVRNLQMKQFQNQMKNHANKLSRLLAKADTNIDEHINNISSYHLSFFEKLILSRGLQFSLPQHCSSRDIQASFEKAFWKVEPLIKDQQKKELSCATLRSIALNYIDKKCPKPPKQLLRAISSLKRREDIIITKPDKGSGVVVMDKSMYLDLLSQASINNTTKFAPVDESRPKTRGRPPKHYHPLLAKEKQLNERLHKILPKALADQLATKGSRLAHLYGLPKTHKTTLCMRPILSASGTYNYALAKWLEEKLKPLSTNKYCINDIFQFAQEIRDMVIEPDQLLVSYDVTSLFTNVPLDETINILVDKAFEDDWFNATYKTQLEKPQLAELLHLSTNNQLFQFNGCLYEQRDGVAMGSPLGPLLANVFMCSIESKLEQDNKIPSFYRRYVDDTLVLMPNVEAASSFLDHLNNIHPSLSFTMEVEHNNSIAFLGISITRKQRKLETQVYTKPTNAGLLLHFKSHVDNRYKKCLVNTMVNRAHKLSSTDEAFSSECAKLRNTFIKLGYPISLINSVIAKFTDDLTANEQNVETNTEDTIYLKLPFKDQSSADRLRRELCALNSKVNTNIKAIFTSKKIKQILSPKETKPSVINNQRVVYLFKCDSCDANYVGYTKRHLHQRVAEHSMNSSSIGKHFKSAHNRDIQKNPIDHLFKVIKKCTSKWDCLMHEMLLIRDIKPTLNKQSDSIRAKLFK